jgi:L-ascorbate metabolism protein UlaG (beta-lactamase superfamily)
MYHLIYLSFLFVMKHTILVCVIIVYVLSACNQQDETKTTNNAAPDSTEVKLTYLGTAGWEITDGKTVILIDPYLSRIRRNYSETSIDSTFPEDTRIPIGPNDFVISDINAINNHIKNADYILVHHSHRDHIMDVPYIALKTGATVIGTESTANFMGAYGVPEEKIITVKGGEDYDFGTFSLKVIPSLHSPLFEKKHYDSRIFPKDKKAPLRITDFVEGGSLAFLIRFRGHEILTSGSMNYIEKELEGLHPDIAIVGAAASRSEIYDYAGRLMRVLNYPAIVLPTHWDNFTLPFTSAQEEKLKELDVFQKEITKASPGTKVIVPKYFEAIILPLRK